MRPIKQRSSKQCYQLSPWALYPQTNDDFVPTRMSTSKVRLCSKYLRNALIPKCKTWSSNKTRATPKIWSLFVYLFFGSGFKKFYVINQLGIQKQYLLFRDISGSLQLLYHFVLNWTSLSLSLSLSLSKAQTIWHTTRPLHMPWFSLIAVIYHRLK